MDLLIPVLKHDAYGVNGLSKPAIELLRIAFKIAAAEAERTAQSAREMGDPKSSAYVRGVIEASDKAQGFIQGFLARLTPSSRTAEAIGRLMSEWARLNPSAIPDTDLHLAGAIYHETDASGTDRHVRVECHREQTPALHGQTTLEHEPALSGATHPGNRQ